jgi:hypothetical protein
LTLLAYLRRERCVSMVCWRLSGLHLGLRVAWFDGDSRFEKNVMPPFLDPTCNWKEFEPIVYEPSTSELVQERTHNAVNELTGITESTGPVWFAPVHDAGGNMVEFPTLDDPTVEFKGVYDAWNRLVEVLDDADDPVVSFAYDGLGRRIVKDDGTTERHYYCAGNQVVEEQVSGTAERQFVHGLRGPGDLVLRDREDGTDLDDERFYALQDAAGNVVALGTTTGGVYDRYIYDAYGYPTRLSNTYTTTLPDSVDWETLYIGLRWDDETELYVAGRYYHAKLGRDLTRNPAGYMGGMNLYAACGSFSLGSVALSAFVPVIVPPPGPGIPGGGGGGAPGNGGGGGGGGGVPGGPPGFDFPPGPPRRDPPPFRIRQVCVPRLVPGGDDPEPQHVGGTFRPEASAASITAYTKYQVTSAEAIVDSIAHVAISDPIDGNFDLMAEANVHVVFQCQCIMPKNVCRAGVSGVGFRRGTARIHPLEIYFPPQPAPFGPEPWIVGPFFGRLPAGGIRAGAGAGFTRGQNPPFGDWQPDAQQAPTYGAQVDAGIDAIPQGATIQVSITRARARVVFPNQTRPVTPEYAGLPAQFTIECVKRWAIIF